MHVFTLMTKTGEHSVNYIMLSLLIAKKYFYLTKYVLENKLGHLRRKNQSIVLANHDKIGKVIYILSSNLRYLLDLLHLSDTQDFFEMRFAAGSQGDACN